MPKIHVNMIKCAYLIKVLPYMERSVGQVKQILYGEKARKNVTKAKAYVHLNMTPMWRCP